MKRRGQMVPKTNVRRIIPLVIALLVPALATAGVLGTGSETVVNSSIDGNDADRLLRLLGKKDAFGRLYEGHVLSIDRHPDGIVVISSRTRYLTGADAEKLARTLGGSYVTSDARVQLLCGQIEFKKGDAENPDVALLRGKQPYCSLIQR